MPVGLAVAIAVSVLLHIVLLSLHFASPDWSKTKSAPQTLEVVLVNSKSKTKPLKSEVLAQANLDGGGNVDEDRRAKTPLPARPDAQKGDDVQRAQRRVQQLEAEQRKLMTAAQSNKAVAAPEEKVAEAPTPTLSGTDLRDSALMTARMEAQLSERIEEYNKRPRKTFIGTRARETRFALYVEAWRQKVERVGNNNYPDNARGRIYGSLRMTVAIRPDGSIDSMQIERGSGHQVLDHAAEKIVRLAAPFAAFPDDIRRDTDIMVITRTWTFAPGDKLFGD